MIIDISKPLCRGRVISLDSGIERWVPFKYERLPSLCFWCGCLTHDDRDCRLWIESEGSLSHEAQQFGPWLKATPFIPSRRYMVKVPGFFAGKKGGVSKDNAGTTEKPPVMVVQSKKPTPVIIRLEMVTTEACEAGCARKQPAMNVHTKKPPSETFFPDMESVEACNERSNESGLKETSQQKLRMPTDEGIMEEGLQHQTGSIVLKVADESFEKVLGEIDKEIKKYDPKSTVASDPSVSIGKENFMGQPCINESNMPSLSGHATHLSLSLRMPLAEIPIINHVKAEGTWKRFMRVKVGPDVGIAEALGEKRSAGNLFNQTELPKKRRVSQDGATKNKILAEVVYQPCQKQ